MKLPPKLPLRKMAVIGMASANFNQMDKEIQKIVDAIKINVEIAKVDGKPLIAEVSMNEKSKEYVASLIKEYGNIRYQEGVEYGSSCP